MTSHDESFSTSIVWGCDLQRSGLRGFRALGISQDVIELWTIQPSL
jgi:hypothetical protein